MYMYGHELLFCITDTGIIIIKYPIAYKTYAADKL
jgi:hypothetical protein